MYITETFKIISVTNPPFNPVSKIRAIKHKTLSTYKPSVMSVTYRLFVPTRTIS